MGKGDIRYLSIAQAAKQLGIHPETLRVHVRKGHIPYEQDLLASGRPIRIEQQDLITFAAQMGRTLG
jgi:excisionase family DNA binding protein